MINCKNKNFKKNAFLIILLFNSILVNYLSSQDLKSEICETDSNSVSYFYEPYPQKVGSYIFQLGGLFTFVPTPIVEDEYPFPSLDMEYKRGIFPYVSFEARFTTNIVSNIFHFGIQGNTNFENLSLGLSNHVGTFAGFMSYEGQFDNNYGYAFYYLPTARIGYRFDEFSVSLSFSTTYLLKTVSKVSNIKEMNIDFTWNDIFFTFAVEQPFLKKQHISLGMSLLYTRTPYQTWMLFNTIDEYQFEPEFFFSFQL